MISFVIFWAAFFAGVFYILSIILNGLSSILNALRESCIGIVGLGSLAGVIAVVLYSIYGVVKAILLNQFWVMLLDVIIVMIIAGVLFGLAIGIGGVFIEVLAVMAISGLEILSLFLEATAIICENVYNHFLHVITRQIERG